MPNKETEKKDIEKKEPEKKPKSTDIDMKPKIPTTVKDVEGLEYITEG